MKRTRDLQAKLAAGAFAHRAPVARGVPGPRPPDHHYVGRRSQDIEVYVVSSAGIAPLEHRRYRGNAPFDWGAPSPGALELAFAMLAHASESRPPDLICATFWIEVVACLECSGFVLGYGDLALWLLTAFGRPPA